MRESIPMHMHIHAEAVCPSVCLCEDVPVCEMCDMLRKLRPKICLLERQSGRERERWQGIPIEFVRCPKRSEDYMRCT